MSYLVNETRLTRVIIGGSDVTEAVTDITLSDSSAIKNGLIATDGEIKMGYRPGATPRDDYKRSLYLRGTPIEIYVTYPSGLEDRHPRGSLVVFDTLFVPEKEELVISVGCKMAFAALQERVDELLPLPNFYLPPTRRNYSSISAALATEGRVAWYDKDGILRSDYMFSGETQTTSPAPNWVSVFGTTALAVSAVNKTRSFELKNAGPAGSPYQGSDPDNIELSYEYAPCRYTTEGSPICPDNAQEPDIIETATSESRYYAQYPAVYYERVATNTTFNNAVGVSQPSLNKSGRPDSTTGKVDATKSDCQEKPRERENPAASKVGGGSSNGQVSCMSGYQTARSQLMVGVSSSSITTTYYRGPGKARDRVESAEFGPALSANGQYIGDLYQLCRQSWADACNPNGFCGTSEGTRNVQLGASITTVEFNADGSVSTEITDTYATKVSALSPDSWRSGVQDGKLVGFTDVPNPYQLYRQSRRVVEYQYPVNGTYRKTTEYTARSEWGSLVPSIGEMDAMNGLARITIDRSKSNRVNADAPPSLTVPEPETLQDQSLVVFPDHDLGAPGQGAPSGNINFKESVPYPFILKDGDPLTPDDYLVAYENYLVRVIKGMALGVRIGETLREDIGANWAPNYSFRYSDPRYNTLISMRGDAHTWSLTPNTCNLTVDGLTIGFSDGIVNIPNNLQGVETPILP